MEFSFELCVQQAFRRRNRAAWRLRADRRPAQSEQWSSTTVQSTATACCCVGQVGMLRIHRPSGGGGGSAGRSGEGWILLVNHPQPRPTEEDIRP